MTNKTGNRKYFRTIKKVEEEFNYESIIISSTSLIELNNNIRLCLKDKFDILESKLYITNSEYEKFIKQESIDTVLLDRETKYLEEEGVLSWVQDSEKSQIVPSPFHSYGKSSIFITPIFFENDFIGYYISLSISSRLEFNDKKLSNYDKIINRYCLKLELLVNNKRLEFYKTQNNFLSKKLNELPELINCKTVMKSTAENIIESVLILKSNLNLLDSDTDMYFTRLKKISSEVEDIHKLSSSLQTKLSFSDSKTDVGTITKDILNLLHNKINEAEFDIHISNLDSIIIKENQNIVYNAILNIIDYLVTTNLSFKYLNIVGKTKTNNSQIMFFLGLEHYTINNISSPESLTDCDVPNDLIITNNALENIDIIFDIKYSSELGFLIKVVI